MDLRSSIKAFCLELMEEEGAYLTPKAFRKPTKKDINSPTGFGSSPKPNMYVKTMKFKIVQPTHKNSIELKEARYSQFKKTTTKRSPSEALHRGIKEIQFKLDEVNRLIEFTSKMKNELKENDNEIQFLNRTKLSLDKLMEKIEIIKTKIKEITE